MDSTKKTELAFEIGGLARHLTFNKTTNLLILNVTDKEVLTRYGDGGIFYTQTFFKHELKPYEKKPSTGLSYITY